MTESMNNIELPPLPRLQVPRVEADMSLTDIKALARWCERTAIDYARAAVLADRASREPECAVREIERDGLAAEIERLREEVDALREALTAMVSWFPSANTYSRWGIDPAAPMEALKEAKAVLYMTKGG